MGSSSQDSMEAAAFQKIHTEAFHRKFWVQGCRPDGRKLNEPRQTHLQPGVLSRSHADGSAMARLGNTTVVAGVCAKLETVPPSDTHNTAQQAPPPAVEVHVELPSLCSPNIRMSAPAPFHAQAIAHSAQQLIDRSGMMAEGALDLALKAATHNGGFRSTWCALTMTGTYGMLQCSRWSVRLPIRSYHKFHSTTTVL